MICEEDHGGTAVAGGTYDDVDGPLAPVCEWDDITPADWSNASADINSFCNQILNTTTSGEHYQDGTIPDGLWGRDVYPAF